MLSVRRFLHISILCGLGRRDARRVKAGTQLQAVAWYGNSRNNLHNPDPEAAVRWGEQTYDEMMVGFFDVAVPPEMDKHRFFARPERSP